MIDANIIVPVILFILLSQPVLRQFSILVRAAIFGVIYFLLRRTFPSYY